VFFRQNWKIAYFVMALTIVIDVDHLLAMPVYDAARCSIGFHPLHGMAPIALYGLLCFFPKARVVGIGLLIHMALDAVDCRMTSGVWFV
jgi:hypothetical protein